MIDDQTSGQRDTLSLLEILQNGVSGSADEQHVRPGIGVLGLYDNHSAAIGGNGSAASAPTTLRERDAAQLVRSEVNNRNFLIRSAARKDVRLIGGRNNRTEKAVLPDYRS